MSVRTIWVTAASGAVDHAVTAQELSGSIRAASRELLALCGARFVAAALVSDPGPRCRTCDRVVALRIARRAGVRLWTYRESRALRQARRMTVREFAEYLGVSARMVSKWEAANAPVSPRPVNQAVLDSALTQCDDLERSRFELLLGSGADGRGADGFAQSAEYRHAGVSRASTTAAAEHGGPAAAGT